MLIKYDFVNDISDIWVKNQNAWNLCTYISWICNLFTKRLFYLFYFFFVFEFIDLNKQAVIYKAKALKQIQINSKGQP